MIEDGNCDFEFGDQSISWATSSCDDPDRRHRGAPTTLSAKYAQYSSALRTAARGRDLDDGARSGSRRRAKTAVASARSPSRRPTTGRRSGWAFVSDLGVKYRLDGQPLKYNSGTLATTGEYKNTAAAYTLAPAMRPRIVDVSYVYSITAGETATISNRRSASRPTSRPTPTGRRPRPTGPWRESSGTSRPCSSPGTSGLRAKNDWSERRRRAEGLPGRLRVIGIPLRLGRH